MISPEEEAKLNEAGSALSPGFRMFREDEFQEALREAADDLGGHEELLVKQKGKTFINQAKLVAHVCRDRSREGYGVPFAWWYIYFEMEFLKGVKMDPWSQVRWWLWDELRGKRKNLTIHGSQSSVKTSGAARFAICQMAIWGENAYFYVTGPYKEHGKDKAWSNIARWFNLLKIRPSLFASSLGLKFENLRTECRIIHPDGGAGECTFVSLESASSIQGKKSVEHDPMVGISGLIVDEFIENPNLDLQQGEGNYSSNMNYFGIFPCNPLAELVQHPAVLPFSAPVDINISALRRDRDYRWRTAYGLLIRLAWSNCPNKILGRTEWSYMMSLERKDTHKDKGATIIDSQVDAWGWGTTGGTSPLDEAAIRMAGTLEPFNYDGPKQMFMMVDCAFGGEDPATYCILEAASVIMKGADGSPVRKRVIIGATQGKLHVDAAFVATDEWLEEMADLFSYSGGGFPKTEGLKRVQAGDFMGGNWHLAGLVLAEAYKAGVPANCVSFDSSQRGDCTAAMMDALGRTNVRWYYEGSRKITDEESLSDGWYQWPYEYEKDTAGDFKPKKWSTYCSQSISMMWFFACQMIRNGYLVNGEGVRKGLDELCARPVVRGRHGQGEGRRDVLGKEKLKDMGMKSPTWGETLAMGIYYVVRFHGAINLQAPELAVQTQPDMGPREIIRSGKNMRFQMGPQFFSLDRRAKATTPAEAFVHSQPLPMGSTQGQTTDFMQHINRLTAKEAGLKI